MAFTLIDHTEIGSGGASSWSKTSIPTDGTYDHLYLKMSLRSEYTGNYYTQIKMTLNDITSLVYSRVNLWTAGATPASTGATTQPAFQGGYVSTDKNGSGIFGICEIWFPNYTSSHFKSFICNSSAQNDNTSQWYWYLDKAAGMWQQTAAIDEINIVEINGSDWGEYSTFSLYGLTGA